MRKGRLIVVGLALVIALLGTAGCNDQTSGESDFKIIFKYGVMARNELDTFEGTYTKDMVEGPPAMTKLRLSKEEMDRIYQKMVEIDFFNYPDRFSISAPPNIPIGGVTPYSSYYFKVEYNSQIKELWWEDNIIYEDEKADRLRELIKLIRDIVESKEEYKELPPRRSLYL